MNQDEFLAAAKATFERCHEILQKKNKDYAGVTAVDPFANFRVAPAILTGITAERGVLVRITDKLKRLDNLLTQEAFVTEESFDDTCDDLINYAVIVKLLRRASKT
jgi:hypothetical protein